MKPSPRSFAFAAVFLTGLAIVPPAFSQGGTPSLSSLSPNTAVAGGAGFTITVTGGGFVNGFFNASSVQWNGTGLSTTYVSSGQLTAVVPANLIASQGTVSVTVENPGGAMSNALTFTITPASTQLSISSLSPSSAAPGGSAFTLTVNGANFASAAVVQWNGSTLSTSFVSANQLTAFVPASLIASAGSASVTVMNPSGTVSNSLTFTIGTAPTPTLISLSPNTAIAGTLAFTLTVTGTNFVSGAAVQWNGSGLSTTYVSGSQLSAFVPANLIASSGSATVTVVNPGGRASNGLTFLITSNGAPVLSSLSPNFTGAGGPSFTLTVNGFGFVSGSVVQWNGSLLLTTYISASQVTAFVPASLITSQATISVTVMNPGGVVSNALGFTVSPTGTPTLLSLSPNFTAAGGSAFTLTLNGSGFLNGAVAQWNGTALSTGYVNNTQMSALIPASLITLPGTANITVVNPGAFISNTLTFTIGSSAAPSLFSLSPSAVSAGGAAFTLTLYGSGFQTGSVAQWNGTALTTGFSSGNQLSAFVTAGLIASQGSATITVVNPSGANSNPLTLTINPSTGPTVSSLSPISAAAGGASFTLTVTGTNFAVGAAVQWNGAALPTTFSGSTTQLTASVSSSLIATPGTANITVVNSNGQASNGVTFSILGFGSSLRVAQIADGSNWKTLIQVVNLDPVPVNFSMQFWDDNGNGLALPFTNGTPGTFSGTLPVGGTAFAETPGTAAALTQGWAEAASSGRIGILTIFRQIVAGRPDSEGTVAGVVSGNRVVLPFDDANGYTTGVAIANTNPSQQLFISLLFQLENGTQSSGSLSLPPHAHSAFVLPAMFPALNGVRGSITFTASTPDIAVVGLRFSPTNSFTSLGAFQ